MAGAAHLWARLDTPPGSQPLLRLWEGEEYLEWSRADWTRAAERFAGGLRRAGVQPDDRVACLLTNSSAACAAVLGTWFVGGCLLSLPLIPRGMAFEAYVAMLRRIVQRSEPVLILCEPWLRDGLAQAGLDRRVLGFDQVDGPPLRDPFLATDESPVFAQFSSGSTTNPRGCLLTPRAIATQLQALERALDIDPERDIGAVWLPLAHDMGLFGCLLLSYWTNHPVAISTPQRFLTQPWTWLEDCARFGSTLTVTPNFALDIVSRVARVRRPPPLQLRRVVIGGERIEPAVLARAVHILGDRGLVASTLVPAYGLAEAVLAVTMTPLARGPKIAEVDATALSDGVVVDAPSAGVGRTVPVVSAGVPLAGTTVLAGQEGAVGEVLVQTPSLALGYLDDEAETARRFTPRGLSTGDLGFVRDGELFLTGRLEDLMCVGGRNVYSRDIETALAGIAAVRPGACAVVDVDGDRGSRLVVFVELRDHHSDTAVVAAEIRARARAAVGVDISECVFLEKGQLPKTPSGKVQRFRCRELVNS